MADQSIDCLHMLSETVFHKATKIFAFLYFFSSYFIIKFDSSALKMFQLQRFYRREDENIIRVGIVLNEDEPRRPCLDGPCRFGEIFPEHDKMAYKRGVYKKLKYPRAESTSKRYTT